MPSLSRVDRGGLASLGLLALALGVPALADGCSRKSAEVPLLAGPIVLVTFEDLRADAVLGDGSDPRLTPRFHRLADGAAFAGRAIALSAYAESSAATLLTGLRPWHHQVLAPDVGELPGAVLPLAEALRNVGYRTTGFGSNREIRLGLSRGFDEFVDAGRGWPPVSFLSRLAGGRQFVWIHLPEPRPPYLRRDWLLQRLEDPPAKLPRRLTQTQIDGMLGSGPASPEAQRLLAAMYRLNVAWADELLGRLVDALAASGQLDRTLLVVTALRGEDFGPGRFGARDGGLGRRMLEVPLAIRLPESFGRRLAASGARAVGSDRIFATIAEAAGAPVPPAARASLFREDGGAVLSELYAGWDGRNRFSLLAGTDQLVTEVSYAAGIAPRADQLAAFGRTPPLSGAGEASGVRDHLLRWGPGGSRPREDAARAAALQGALREEWHRFVPRELSPADEARAIGLAPRSAPPPPRRTRRGASRADGGDSGAILRPRPAGSPGSIAQR